MEQLKKIEELYELNKFDEALNIIDEFLKDHPKDEQLHFWKGKIHYKKQEWGLAINEFNIVLEINPDNQEAKTSAELANAILGYYTPDMFNP